MNSDVSVEVRDVGMIDQISRHRGWEVDHGNGNTSRRNQNQQHSIPEDIMAELEQHIGDAQAKITVGAELAHSIEYGCKAKAFVSVSATCNNSEESITAVHGIIQPLARFLVNEDLDKMKGDRDAHMGTTPAVEGKVSAPPQATAKGKVSAKPPAVQRPSFRR
jgi:hypothetical protein